MGGVAVDESAPGPRLAKVGVRPATFAIQSKSSERDLRSRTNVRGVLKKAKNLYPSVVGKACFIAELTGHMRRQKVKSDHER